MTGRVTAAPSAIQDPESSPAPRWSNGGNRIAYWNWGLMSLITVLSLSNFWWVVHFREGYPIDFDEVQFMIKAYDLTYAARSSGLSAFWNEFQTPVWFTPLVPILTVPMFVIF